MRSSRFVLLLALLAFAKSAVAQKAAASTPPAAALLQQSLIALDGGQTITDITLSGAARSVSGSNEESGNVIVKVLAGTGTRIDLALPSGTRSELRNTSSDPLAGSWSGVDGITHAIPYHNLLTDSGWFPAVTLASFVSAQNAVITYVGTETRYDQSVLHIRASQQFPASLDDAASVANLMGHLTQTDVYLDPNTLLPLAITFNTHPDNNANLDIPVEIRFSDFRTVNTVKIPFRIQKFVNNNISLELQFSSIVVNSGLSANSFTVGA